MRLQPIARDAGISHATLLHHVGSRERLLAELVRRAAGGLQDELFRTLATRRAGDSPWTRAERTRRMFELTHRVYDRGGYARLLAGLLLSGRDLRKEMRGILAPFGGAVHENRVQRHREHGKAEPTLESSLFGSSIVMLVLFADALIGREFRAALGLPGDRATGERFRRWMASVLEGFEPEAAPTPRDDRETD